MKRSAFLLAFLLGVCSHHLQAQETPAAHENYKSVAISKGGYIAILLGPSFPVGDYASTDIAGNEQAGLAKTGFSIYLIDFAYAFNRNVGIAASWFGGANQIDAQALADFYASYYGGSWEVTGNPYSYGGLFAGLFLTEQINDWHFDLKIRGGFASGNFPEIKYKTNGGQVTQKASSANTFGYSFASAVRYNVSQKIGLMLQVDFTSLKPEADITLTSSNGLSQTVTYKQPMQCVQVDAGVAFRIK